MSKRMEMWSPTDHACRECSGRVVRVNNAGPTGGGNPVWRCADCGIAMAEMGPECICWCGFNHKGQDGPVYMCVRMDRGDHDPAVELALMRAGYGNNGSRHRPRTEIAVIAEDTLRWAAQKISEDARKA